MITRLGDNAKKKETKKSRQQEHGTPRTEHGNENSKKWTEGKARGDRAERPRRQDQADIHGQINRKNNQKRPNGTLGVHEFTKSQERMKG